jgi:serine/threonine protein kinase
MVKDVLKMGVRLIKILEGLHSIGLCHLDIKPDNIMIRNQTNENGQQKELVLIDLGQA